MIGCVMYQLVSSSSAGIGDSQKFCPLSTLSTFVIYIYAYDNSSETSVLIQLLSGCDVMCEKILYESALTIVVAVGDWWVVLQVYARRVATMTIHPIQATTRTIVMQGGCNILLMSSTTVMNRNTAAMVKMLFAL